MIKEFPPIAQIQKEIGKIKFKKESTSKEQQLQADRRRLTSEVDMALSTFLSGLSRITETQTKQFKEFTARYYDLVVFWSKLLDKPLSERIFLLEETNDMLEQLLTDIKQMRSSL